MFITNEQYQYDYGWIIFFYRRDAVSQSKEKQDAN